MGKATVEIRSDTEVVITRTFDAPRAIVFEALTTPEHVKRWYGLEALSMVVCEIDFRVGGRWRYVVRAPDGTDHGFTGVYQEIDAPRRIVSTENYEALMPGHELLVTTTLDEASSTTTLRSHLRYQSRADRDGHLQSGMEAGMQETFDRLEVLLPALV